MPKDWVCAVVLSPVPGLVNTASNQHELWLSLSFFLLHEGFIYSPFLALVSAKGSELLNSALRTL
uniref:Uncharacterized protein n=1 Tax=Hordeum vulgare subsp. vulgare TaxID=112509 RepID=A0A8I6XQ21_HORVV